MYFCTRGLWIPINVIPDVEIMIVPFLLFFRNTISVPSAFCQISLSYSVFSWKNSTAESTGQKQNISQSEIS